MSTGIRPPGGAPGISGTGGLEGASEVDAGAAAEGASPAERAASAASVAPPSMASVEQPTAALLSRLDAGEITRDQAIDALVAEAMESHGAARLPQTQRAELETIMRAALLDDPTLARLLG